jgi:hypothetical protein
MAYGLQIWDETGQLTFDTDSRITRFIGVYSYAAFNSSTPQSITVPGISTDGTWAIVPQTPTISLQVNTGYVLVTYPFPNTNVPAGAFNVFRF